MTTVADRVGATERAISRVLRAGVLLSLACLVSGTVLMLLQPDGGFLSDPAALAPLLSGDAGAAPPWQHLVSRLIQGRGEALATVGLLVLILTPVVRVAISIRAFVVQHDRVYTAITSLVLLLLLISFALGAGA